jgi:hypothetical protein
MGVLGVSAAAFVIAAGGCYEPELRDCTLTCSSASDCADGQVCGDDQYCAAPGIAGRCASLPGDAGSNSRDGGIDARTIPDAATHVTLTISIEGQGRTVMLGTGTCDKAAPQNGMCMFTVPIDALVTVQAQPYPKWRFDKWTTTPCRVSLIGSCTFTATSSLTIGVKFRKDD